jgi:hypothetical protein
MVDITSVDFIRELTPENAWKLRWAFDWDMNHDGQFTISDISKLASWAFFAPGDCLFLGIMLKLPGLATFLEITPKYLYGWWSLFISLFAWWSVIGAVANELKT